MKNRHYTSRRWFLGAVAKTSWAIFALLPVKQASDVAGFLGRHVGIHLLKRDVIASNFRMAFPQFGEERIAELTRGVAENIARLFAEVARLGDIGRRAGGADVELVGAHHLTRGKPAIFVGPHLSNWEVGVIAISRVLGPMNVIYTPVGIPSVDRQLLSHRQQTGSTYFERSRAAMRSIMTGIEEGRSVALLVDQRVPSGPAVDFFGRSTIATGFPAWLAMRCNVPIIPVNGRRERGDRFVITLSEPLYPEDFPQEDREYHLTQRMMTAVEGFIRSAPQNWFCNKARWRTKETASVDDTAPAGPPAVPGMVASTDRR
jgi:KDO2-lipid IV(A) lauroyltransferase